MFTMLGYCTRFTIMLTDYYSAYYTDAEHARPSRMIFSGLKTLVGDSHNCEQSEKRN